MANVIWEFPPDSGVLPSSAFAVPTQVDGTNFSVRSLAFNASTDTSATFPFEAANYASGDLTVQLEWYADTGTSGVVVWTAALAAITPDADSTDVETKAFGTAASVSDTHLGTTGQRLHRATITVTSLDSLAAGDACWLKITRDADNGSDNLSGNANLTRVVVSYLST